MITIELLGLEKLTNAFGLLLLPQGIAIMIGAPIAGQYQYWEPSCPLHLIRLMPSAEMHLL